jgi:hypothetical protein
MFGFAKTEFNNCQIIFSLHFFFGDESILSYGEDQARKKIISSSTTKNKKNNEIIDSSQGGCEILFLLFNISRIFINNIKYSSLSLEYFFDSSSFLRATETFSSEKVDDCGKISTEKV